MYILAKTHTNASSVAIVLNMHFIISITCHAMLALGRIYSVTDARRLFVRSPNYELTLVSITAETECSAMFVERNVIPAKSLTSTSRVMKIIERNHILVPTALKVLSRFQYGSITLKQST